VRVTALTALPWHSLSQTLAAAAVFYQRRLKPAIVRRCLKAR
jgi:hypothetical protein